MTFSAENFIGIIFVVMFLAVVNIYQMLGAATTSTMVYFAKLTYSDSSQIEIQFTSRPTSFAYANVGLKGTLYVAVNYKVYAIDIASGNQVLLKISGKKLEVYNSLLYVKYERSLSTAEIRSDGVYTFTSLHDNCVEMSRSVNSETIRIVTLDGVEYLGGNESTFSAPTGTLTTKEYPDVTVTISAS